MEVVLVLIDFDRERALCDTVREWVLGMPGGHDAAERACEVARAAYAGGASVPEACRQARAFAGSWARHPSRTAVAHRAPVVALRPVPAGL